MTWTFWDLGKVDRNYQVFVVKDGDRFRVGRRSPTKRWWVGGWRQQDHLMPRSHAFRCCYGEHGTGETIEPLKITRLGELLRTGAN